MKIDPGVAALLPCNVAVRREGSHTVIDALVPRLIAGIPGKDGLRSIAEG